MSTQSCVVMLAVLALILAVIVNTTAFGAPKWMTGKTQNGTELILTSRGLWEACVDTECTLLVWSEQSSWFRAVQAFFSIGTSMCIVTLVIFCSIFAVNMSTEKMYLILWFIMITNIISSVCFCISLGVYGTEATTAPFSRGELEHQDRQLDWAFYVAIWGAIFSLATSILLIWEGCMAANWFSNRSYYDL